MEGFLQDINIPVLDEVARKKVYDKWNQFNKYECNLGELESLVANISAMTGKKPKIEKKAMILACGDHGIARYGVSNFPQEVTVQMIDGYIKGKAGANILANHAGIANEDLFIVDIGVNADLSKYEKVINKKVAYGTEDFTKGFAMSREQAISSLKAGFEVASDCIDKGYGMLVLSDMGIGNTTSSAAIASVFTGLPPEKTVGRGTGIGDKRLAIKRQVVIDGLAINKPDKDDAVDVLAKVGGYELGGLAGVIIAGASRRVPVFIDGMNASAAALIANGLFPYSKNYMLPSHLSAEIAHHATLEILQLKPLLTASMRLGEGTGVGVFAPILDAAIEVFNSV